MEKNVYVEDWSSKITLDFAQHRVPFEAKSKGILLVLSYVV